MAAPVSSTPMRMRNQTGKCQTVKARAQPLVSGNLASPWRAKIQARNSAGTHSTRSRQGIFFMEAPPAFLKEPPWGGNFPPGSHLLGGFLDLHRQGLGVGDVHRVPD